MKLIDWINKITKLNQTTMTNFQKNINDGKVDKTGDTMTGRLNIENKTEFTGINKTRTINGADYSVSLGVGADASASLELHDASGSLGRIDVNKDGKIKNFKTGKYLVEQNAWQNATNNSENISQGLCKYLIIGDALIISIHDVIVKKDLSHGALLFSGLPSNKTDWGFLVDRYATANPVRLKYSAGKIYLWYDSITANNSQFYGSTVF